MGVEVKPEDKPDVKPDEKPDEKKSSVTVDQLLAALKYMHAENQKMVQRLSNMESRFEAINTPKPDKKDDPIDVEGMTNSELVTHITKQITASILEPVQKQITELGGRINKNDLNEQLKEVTKTYSDFFEFREEIEKRMKDNPALSLDDAYTLARKDNKEKADTIDKKKAEEAAAVKEKEKPAFSGLLPTSTITKPTQRMKPKEAAESAFDEVMADVPAELWQ